MSCLMHINESLIIQSLSITLFFFFIEKKNVTLKCYFRLNQMKYLKYHLTLLKQLDKHAHMVESENMHDKKSNNIQTLPWQRLNSATEAASDSSKVVIRDKKCLSFKRKSYFSLNILSSGGTCCNSTGYKHISGILLSFLSGLGPENESSLCNNRFKSCNTDLKVHENSVCGETSKHIKIVKQVSVQSNFS